MYIKKFRKIFFILLVLLYSNMAIAFELIQIGNLEVSIDSNKQNVLVTRDSSHVFSVSCEDRMLCDIFIANKIEPKYQYEDGMVKTNSDVLNLTIGNLNAFKNRVNYDDKSIGFVVSIASPTATYSDTGFYLIDIKTGSVTKTIKEVTWYRNGMSTAVN